MIKRILVHLDASPRSATRLALALAQSQMQPSEVVAQYGVLPAMLALPWVTSEGMACAASALADVDDDQRRRARAVFDQAGPTPGLVWADGGATPYGALLQQAYTSDLLVLGQADATDASTGTLPPDLVPALLTDSGRPALVVPAAGSFATLEGPVLLAWKPAREATRALVAALPWLRRAPRVHLAMPVGSDREITPAALCHWLLLHGVHAPVRHHLLANADVGDALLSLATDVDAAVLVMGCYGHSRTREWVLGGTTRTVLRTMTLPVLMVH